MYIFRISVTRSGGNSKLSTITCHSFSLFTLSYALLRSMKAILRGYLVWRLCWISVCKINACSIVPWCSLNPAYVGACNCSAVAAVVSRWFTTAMRSLAKGGVMAIDR